MPSPTETYILLTVLGLVLLSLPIAMLLWRRKPADAGVLAAAPWPAGDPAPEYYAPPGAPALPPPLPPLPQFLDEKPAHFTRADAWFAIFLVFMVAVMMGPISSLLVMAAEKSAAVSESAPSEPEAFKIKFTAPLFITQISIQAVIIGFVLVWFSVVRKMNLLRVFGIKERGPLITAGLAFLWLLGAWVALIVVSAALMPVMQQLSGMELKQQTLVESAPEITDSLTRGLMLFTLCVGAPLMEELIFRGVIFGVASRYFNPVYACISSSLLFGVIHNNLLSLIPLTVLGIFLAEAYRRSRTLAVPVLMHAVFNGINFALLMYGPPELRKM